MSIYDDRLKVIEDWCEDSGLIFLKWGGTMKDRLYYTYRDMSDYTFSRDVRRVLHNQNEINLKNTKSTSMMTASSQDRYIRNKLSDNGFVVRDLGNELYKRRGETFRFEVFSGDYIGATGSAKLSVLINGKGSIFSHMDDKSKKSFFRSLAERRGYEVVSYPESLQKSRECTLMSPEGNLWDVKWSRFEEGARCTLDKDNRNYSYGELLVASILESNKIYYEPEKRIDYDDGSWQYMDFYIEHGDVSLCIEYHGEHHYREVGWYGAVSLRDVKERDEKKRGFCRDNNISYLEIPYKCKSLEMVYDKISKHLPLEAMPTKESFGKPKYSNLARDYDMVEYYKKHTQAQTMKRFNVSNARLHEACVAHGFRKRGRIKPQKVVGFYKGVETYFDSMAEASRVSNVDVGSFFRKVNQNKPTKGWVFKKVS